MDKKDALEYAESRLKLSNDLLGMIRTAINSNFENKYLATYLQEIEPHITQALDDEYQYDKWIGVTYSNVEKACEDALDMLVGRDKRRYNG